MEIMPFGKNTTEKHILGTHDSIELLLVVLTFENLVSAKCPHCKVTSLLFGGNKCLEGDHLI